MKVNSSDKEKYIQKIEAVFRNAEMNELVALYSALPILAFPEEWKMRCADGIRSNIGVVLEAIMHKNPYPSNFVLKNQEVMLQFFFVPLLFVQQLLY